MIQKNVQRPKKFWNFKNSNILNQKVTDQIFFRLDTILIQSTDVIENLSEHEKRNLRIF